MRTLKKSIWSYMYKVTFALVSVILISITALNIANEQSRAQGTADKIFEQMDKMLEENQKELTRLRQEYAAKCLHNTEAIAYILEKNTGARNDLYELRKIAEFMEVDEIHIIDAAGEIVSGTHPQYYGYSFDSGKQMNYFKPMLKNKSQTMCQDVTPNTAEGKKMPADAVVIATGGCSYASTGSTGDGYRFAEACGHTIKTCSPSLVPFNAEEEYVKELQGLSLKNVKASIYQGKKLLMVGILKGCFMFMADLMRYVELPCQMDFMICSSYGAGTESSGQIKIVKDLSVPIQDCHVLIVEDIIDSGNTLCYVKNLLKERGCKSIKLCTLFDKPSRREAPVYADYIGYEVANEFIVGYGLDFNERYRNLPYVGVLKPEAYQL